MDIFAYEVPPMNFMGLKACLNCGIVLYYEEFYSSGCPNCEIFMRLMGNPVRIFHCTTFSFLGLVTLPEGYIYWRTLLVAVGSLTYGVYAKFLFGAIPNCILFELASEDRIEASGQPSL